MNSRQVKSFNSKLDKLQATRVINLAPTHRKWFVDNFVAVYQTTFPSFGIGSGEGGLSNTIKIVLQDMKTHKLGDPVGVVEHTLSFDFVARECLIRTRFGSGASPVFYTATGIDIKHEEGWKYLSGHLSATFTVEMVTTPSEESQDV